METVNVDDLPPLYCDFDRTSVAAQRAYLRVLRVDLTLLVVSAVVSSFSPASLETRQWIAGVGAACLSGGLIATVLLYKNAYEKTWYGGRAAAETVKSLSWKYMMRAAPFEDSAAPTAVDAILLANFRSILQERRDLALSRTSESQGGTEPITPLMRSVRGRSVQERLTFYRAARIQDQVDWYTSKSQDNERRQTMWSVGLIATHAIAAISAIVQVAVPELSVNLVSALAAIAAAALAWSQIKRYRELAQSYSLAAHELLLASGLAASATNETKLSQFINDTEAAVSREHTMWIARREAPI